MPPKSKKSTAKKQTTISSYFKSTKTEDDSVTKMKDKPKKKIKRVLPKRSVKELEKVVPKKRGRPSKKTKPLVTLSSKQIKKQKSYPTKSKSSKEKPKKILGRPSSKLALASPVKQGRPKPQAKASAKVKQVEKNKEDKDIENNNNNKEKSLSPILNNNNNEDPLKLPKPSEKKKLRDFKIVKSASVSPEKESSNSDEGSMLVSGIVRAEAIEHLPFDKPEPTLRTFTNDQQNGDSTTPKAIIATPSTFSPMGVGKKEVQCKVCKVWFPNRYFQRKHMLMDHEDQLYECRVCSFNSVDPEKLKSHIIKLHVAKKEKSESIATADAMQEEFEQLIDKKVPRKVMMEDGVTLGRDVNNKMRFVCALCNRTYTSKYSMERHVRCHTLEKPYECEVCNFSSSYREHMMRHMTAVHLIVHSNVPKVKYVPKKRPKEEGGDIKQEDGDDDDDDDNLEAANKKRRNILRERFECAVCGLRSTHKTDLVDHIRSKHPNAHIESLANQDGSKVHLIVTMARKPKPSKKLTITCNYCSLIFHDTWKYKIHLRSHTGVKPFSCSLCDVRATSKMTVRDHIHRKHPNSEEARIILRTVSIDGSVEKVELAVPWREFKCEHCQEQFSDNYNLKLHKQKEHREFYPFMCNICNHRELTKASVLIHCFNDHPDEAQNMDELITRNGKPFRIGVHNLPTCRECGKMFPYRSQLNIHARMHTGEKAFSCAHCDFKSNLKLYLEKHIKTVHFGHRKEGEKSVSEEPKKRKGRPRRMLKSIKEEKLSLKETRKGKKRAVKEDKE